MREDEMERRVTQTLEARGGAFGALITGDGVPRGTPMTYYLTAEENADPEGLRVAMAADSRFLPFRYAPDHPFAEADEDAYEGPSHLQDAFTDLARKYGYSLWV